jgi:hypothetical protein
MSSFRNSRLAKIATPPELQASWPMADMHCFAGQYFVQASATCVHHKLISSRALRLIVGSLWRVGMAEDLVLNLQLIPSIMAFVSHSLTYIALKICIRWCLHEQTIRYQ